MTNPLVSVVVVTYNSSRYVLETLESIREQTYEQIELIVTDDCSTDNTLELVEQWIFDHRSRFVNALLVKATKNTGISGNCNRGVRASKANYIKLIAGDDLLTTNCVSDFVQFFLTNPDVKIAAAKTRIFFENDINNCVYWPKPGQFPGGIMKQKKEILKANFVYNASIFFTRELYRAVNGFDEEYAMIEDYPFDYKVIYSGYEFYLMDKVVVNYRVNQDSVSRPSNDNLFINERLFKDAYRFFENVILKELLKERMLLWYFLRYSKIKLTSIIVKNGNYASKKKNYVVHKLLFLNKLISNKLRIFENKKSGS